LGTTVHAQTLSKCSAKKKLCVAKKMAARLKCHIKAEKLGVPVDGICLQKAEDKFDGGANPAKGCFEKIENKQDPLKPETLCLTEDDTAAAEAKIDAFVLDVVTELDPWYPAAVLNMCSSAKKKCVSKKAKALLKCHAKAEKKGVALDPTCVQKAHDKFDGGAEPAKGCFEKLETTKPPCFTNDDTAALEAKVDAFVNDVVSELDPVFPTPTPTPTATCTPAMGGTPVATATPPFLFVDNGDGTITDMATGLQWEKKAGTTESLVDCTPDPATLCPDPHEVDNAYQWCAGTFPTCNNPANPPDGHAFTVFLAALNSAVFAGYSDWRLPTNAELQTLVDMTAPGCGGGGACIHSIFLPVNQVPTYRSSESFPGNNNSDYCFNYVTLLSGCTKSNRAPVRAVRGGLPCP
jgi:hypothetical protein